MRKLIPYAEFKTMEPLFSGSSEYGQKQIEAAQNLHAEVSAFYPAQMMIEVSQDEGNSPWYFERPVVKLTHPDILFEITRDYKGKYHVSAHQTIQQFANVDGYTRRDIEAKLAQPVTMGKLSDKKILAWINYYEEVVSQLKTINGANNEKIAAFLKSIEGMDVHWYEGKKKGSIVRGGIEYKFEIGEEYVSQKIEVRYSVDTSLASFLQISDNQYKSKQ